MALNYPTYAVPQPTKTTILDVLDQWNKGVEAGKAERFEAEAPDQFAQSAAPLSEFGLSTPPDQLREMFRNPNTRPLAIQQVQEAIQRRADASDPMKQLQLQKAQVDLRNAQRGPAGPGPTSEMRNFQFAQDNPGFAEFIGSKGAGKAPADVQEYLWYRENEKTAGRQPLEYLDFVNAQRGSGLSVQTNPDGTVSVTQGGAPGSMPKLTEGQSKDVVYLTKGAGALPLIDKHGDALTNLTEAVGGQFPVVGNYAKSPEYQQAEQAGKEFLAAILRKDTGAAVTKSEEDMYGAMYLPRPGDRPEVLAQKKDARQRALQAIELGVPTSAIVEMERRGALPGRGAAVPTAADPMQGGAPPSGWTGDPSLWRYLTPEERKLWQN